MITFKTILRMAVAPAIVISLAVVCAYLITRI